MRRLRSRREHPATVVGYIEHVNHGVVRGWAFDPVCPKTNLNFYVFVKDIYAGSGKTGIFRPDLAAAGYGNGTHAFVFHIPPDLLQEDAGIGDVAIYTESVTPAQLGQVREDANLEPRVADGAKLTAKAFFDGLVSQMISKTSAPVRTMPGHRRQVETMLEAIPPTNISAFTRHIAAKYGRTVEDKSFWIWYLDHYLIEKGNAKPLLSNNDIEIISKSLGTNRRFFAPTLRLKRRYDWAIEDARRFYIEDCMVSQCDRASLTQIPLLRRNEKFPLSKFMRIFVKKHKFLDFPNIWTVHKRINVYVLIMLFALRDVHLLSYVPSYWLKKVLEKEKNETLFEAAQKYILAGQTVINPAVFRAHVASLGFDLEAQQFNDKIGDKHRVKFGDRILGGEVEVDIQLFGPFERDLGLSNSAARLADAVCSLNFSLNLVNIDIGVSPRKKLSSLPVGNPARAKINIIHLNAEEIPEFMAYSPDCFSTSYNVIFPYWELDRPALAHQLGLSLVDEVWTATEFLAQIFAHSGKPVSCVGMSSNPKTSITRDMGRKILQSLGVPVDRFVFLVTSDALSWAQRKNVLGDIEAFCAAFPAGEASLVVKTRNLDGPLNNRQREHWDAIRRRCRANNDITLLDTEVPEAQQQALLAGSDCLLSLHRAEGLGLDILDAMGIGTPVVATAYSGNLDFCKSDTAWLVDFDLVPVDPRDYCFVEDKHVWAEPKRESAVAAIRGVFFDKAERERRAELGVRLVEARWSRESFARRLDQAIRSIRERLESEEP